jgi:hypothetical protein
MAIGLDVKIGAAKETTFGTRVTPSRFFEITEDGLDYEVNHYLSQGLGGGIWRRKRVQTTARGTGTLPMEVPTAGFGFWLDLLHNETVTPVQQGATAAYLQTHSLASTPAKSATIQIQRPPTVGSTLLSFDYLGCMCTEMEFSWSADGVLMVTPTLVMREQKTDQTLATPTPPAGSGLFSFKGGSVSIGGSSVADITGDGSVKVGYPMRDDAYALGSSGLIMKPLPNERPTGTGQFTADFTDITHYNRVLNDTIADVVVKFEGVTIAGAYKETLEITIPDCGFNGSAPQVKGAGPVSQEVQFENASATADVPSIKYISTDLTV